MINSNLNHLLFPLFCSCWWVGVACICSSLKHFHTFGRAGDSLSLFSSHSQAQYYPLFIFFIAAFQAKNLPKQTSLCARRCGSAFMARLSPGFNWAASSQFM